MSFVTQIKDKLKAATNYVRDNWIKVVDTVTEVCAMVAGIFTAVVLVDFIYQIFVGLLLAASITAVSWPVFFMIQFVYTCAYILAGFYLVGVYAIVFKSVAIGISTLADYYRQKAAERKTKPVIDEALPSAA